MPCPVKETTHEKTALVQARAKSPRGLASSDRAEKRRSDLSRAAGRGILALALEEAIPRLHEEDSFVAWLSVAGRVRGSVAQEVVVTYTFKGVISPKAHNQ